jgi:hypothetical protein
MPQTDHYEGPGLAMSAPIFEALQFGVDYSELQKTAGYKRLMEFLRGRAAAALQAMRDAPYAEDRVKANFQFQWQLCEDVIRDIEREISSRIALAKSVTKDLDISQLAAEGFAMKFEHGEDDEE